MGFKSKIDNQALLLKAVSNSTNRCQTLIELGLTSNQTNYNTLNKYIEKYNISTAHFSNKLKLRTQPRKGRFDDSIVFCVNSSYSRNRLKERLIKNKIIPYECAECGNKGFWNSKPLSLHLEHKNGINDDNRYENLCFLCPNCHSQTDTYAGKNKINKRTSSKE